MDWIEAYGVDTAERPWHLGEPATLTVIMRDLDTDARRHAFIPIEQLPPGDRQCDAIVAAIARSYPNARRKTYNADTQVASFVDSDYLYVVIYEEHRDGSRAEQPPGQQELFAA